MRPAPLDVNRIARPLNPQGPYTERVPGDGRQRPWGWMWGTVSYGPVRHLPPPRMLPSGVWVTYVDPDAAPMTHAAPVTYAAAPVEAPVIYAAHHGAAAPVTHEAPMTCAAPVTYAAPVTHAAPVTYAAPMTHAAPVTYTAPDSAAAPNNLGGTSDLRGTSDLPRGTDAAPVTYAAPGDLLRQTTYAAPTSSAATAENCWTCDKPDCKTIMCLGEGYFCGMECRDRWHDAHPERDHGARGILATPMDHPRSSLQP
jgi:hypothetical protein